jgi:hypothetical protein
MAKTNAQRQAEFRAKMKAKGFRERLVWVDWEGHRAGAHFPEDAHGKPTMNIHQLNGQLKKITEGMNEYDAGRLYGELAAYARGLRARWEFNEENMRQAAGVTK